MLKFLLVLLLLLNTKTFFLQKISPF